MTPITHLSHPQERATLQRWSTAAHKDEYLRCVVARHLSLVDVLEAHPSVAFSLDLLLEFAPKLQPRYYTIASSSRCHPHRIAIAVSITRTLIPAGPGSAAGSASASGAASAAAGGIGNVFTGCATGYLAGLRAGRDSVLVHVRASEFRMPAQPQTTPIIMIGPGSFRVFCIHRYQSKAKNDHML
jgi:sulfite reductase alpha subunit-like flavoprotein